jgi:hypothetical protein
MSIPVTPELLVTKISPRQYRVPTQNNIVGTRHCRVLYYSGATGIDINSGYTGIIGKVGDGNAVSLPKITL